MTVILLHPVVTTADLSSLSNMKLRSDIWWTFGISCRLSPLWNTELSRRTHRYSSRAPNERCLSILCISTSAASPLLKMHDTSKRTPLSCSSVTDGSLGRPGTAAITICRLSASRVLRCPRRRRLQAEVPAGRLPNQR